MTILTFLQFLLVYFAGVFTFPLCFCLLIAVNEHVRISRDKEKARKWLRDTGCDTLQEYNGELHSV